MFSCFFWLSEAPLGYKEQGAIPEPTLCRRKDLPKKHRFTVLSWNVGGLRAFLKNRVKETLQVVVFVFCFFGCFFCCFFVGFVLFFCFLCVCFSCQICLFVCLFVVCLLFGVTDMYIYVM